MVIDVTLLGEPRSTNHIYKSMCRGKFASVYMSKQGKDLKEEYQWQIKSSFKGKPTSKEVDVVINLYFGVKRKHDVDNYNKLILDACSGLIWEDDSQIQSLLVVKHYDKENPRAELTIDIAN